MIYVKSNNKIYTIDTILEKHNLNALDLRYYHFLALKRLIKGALKLANLNIDIYLDLKHTGQNPLGTYVVRGRAKIKTYKRLNDKPFIIAYVCRIFRTSHATTKDRDTQGKVVNFLKVLYHELIHHIQNEKRKQGVYFSRVGHNRDLPAYIGKNNLSKLRAILKEYAQTLQTAPVLEPSYATIPPIAQEPRRPQTEPIPQTPKVDLTPQYQGQKLGLYDRIAELQKTGLSEIQAQIQAKLEGYTLGA